MNRQTASRAVGRLARRKMLQVIRRGGLNQRTFDLSRLPVSDGVMLMDCMHRRLQHCRHFATDTVGAHAYHPRSTP